MKDFLNKYTLGSIHLKEEGHRLIDEIVKLNVDRTRVYKILEIWLQGNSHFSKTQSLDETEKIIKLLKYMLWTKQTTYKIPKTFPWYDYKRYKELNDQKPSI